jgi:ElaB/YqjD/DUF883 family membrane-anchored ribosome-binding protein
MSDVLTQQEGALELSILSAQTTSHSFDEVLTEMLNKGVPAEVLTRMEQLWETTKEIAGEVIQIGKIIVIKILEFVKEHPGLAIGIAVGAAIGALVGLVPFIGPLLQPLGIAVGAMVGGLSGIGLDSSDEVTSPVRAAIIIAREFFKFFASILNSVRDYWVTRGV